MHRIDLPKGRPCGLFPYIKASKAGGIYFLGVLLTLTASVAAVPKWVRKRPRLFALHTFIIITAWR